MSSINLYDGVDASIDAPDVTLVGTNTGPVRGSLVWNPTTRTADSLRQAAPWPQTTTL